MSYPVPVENPCESTGYTTITLTVPDCPEYFWILINQLEILTDEMSYDSSPDIATVTQLFQDMIDLAVYGGSP